MIGFLAFIGLAVILWWVAKKLKQLGNTLTQLGDSMAERSAMNEKSGRAIERALDNLEKAKRRKKDVGTMEKAEHTAAVRDEIDEMEKFINRSE